MSNVSVIYTSNDTLLEVANLVNGLTGEPLNSADVKVTLLDANGIEVDGDTWPKSLLYLTGSRGVYRVTLSHSLPLLAGARYTASVVADGGPGLLATWSVECVARERG